VEYMKRKVPGSEALIVDSLKYISPFVDRLIVGTYLNTVKRTPNIYGKLYKLSETDESISDMTKTFNKLLSYRLFDFINNYNPSVIVCTHTFPLQMLSNLKRKGKIPMPVIGIVTDFVNHLFWKLEGIDAFIVAHDYIRNDMIKMGISKDKIFTYGIPVAGDFLKRRDRSSLLYEFELQNKLTLLIMGGSLGFGEVRDIFASLLECNRDIQIIAVTGQNRKLKSQLEELSFNTEKNVKILSYSDRISDLMDVSDFIITKPGGVTISEALVKKLPILVISPIPGQEEKNARFLINTGVAAQLIHNEDMDSIFCQIMDNPIRVKHMTEMAGCLAKPKASEEIVNLIVKMAIQSESLKSIEDYKKIMVKSI
jgi:processive 1,2-diacylglycerol beta-glucosyltransferase